MGLSLWGQRVNHPALLFTKERVEAAKARVQSDTCMARCWADIRKVADAALEKNDLNRSDYLAPYWVSHVISGSVEPIISQLCQL